MSILITINGEVVNDHVSAADISIDKSRGETWTCSLETVSLDGEIQTITGDGATQQFTLDRIPSNIPSITILSVVQDVGIYGVDTGKDWYWEVGTRNIYQDPLGTPVADLTDFYVDLGTWYPSVGQPILIDVSHLVPYQVTGDGVETEWTLPQTATQLISVTANSILPQTFGIYGVDTGKQYYLDLATNKVIRDAGDGPLPNGDTLDIAYDYWVRLFGGVIRAVDRGKPDSAESPVLKCLTSATDYNHILERRLTGAREWTGADDTTIIEGLIADALTDEGITYTPSDPVNIDSFRVAYDTVAGALTELSKLTEKQFWIDGNKVLRYETPGTTPAPFDIASGATNISTLRVTETDEDYCNYVVVKSAKTVRAEQTEAFTGDGSTTSFTLAYPLASVPTVTVNGTTQNVGVTGVDTGKDWYWSQGSAEIRQDVDGTPLTSSDELAVTYAGTESSYVIAKSDAEIASRAAKEGSSGRYEKFFEIDRLLTTADAQAVADGILADRQTVPLKAVYSTSDAIESEAKNLQPGQSQDLALDGWAAQQNGYIIRSIRATSMGLPESSDYQFRYEVEMYYGSIAKTTFQWFRDLAGGGSSAAGGVASDGGAEYAQFFLGGCDVVTEGDDIAPHRPVLHHPASLALLSSDCKTTPTTDLTYDVKVTRDDGSTWDSIFAAGSAVHPAGTSAAVFTTLFSSAADGLPRGAKFRVDVTSAGGAQGWALKASLRRRTATAGEIGASSVTDGTTMLAATAA